MADQPPVGERRRRVDRLAAAPTTTRPAPKVTSIQTDIPVAGSSPDPVFDGVGAVVPAAGGAVLPAPRCTERVVVGPVAVEGTVGVSVVTDPGVVVPGAVVPGAVVGVPEVGGAVVEGTVLFGVVVGGAVVSGGFTGGSRASVAFVNGT